MTDLLAALESSSIAAALRNSLYLFPFIESLHVVGLGFVFGTIAIVDLRLLGLASRRRPFTRVTADVLKWTWLAFALTVATGLLMFTTRADVYFHNVYFRLKMGLLALAGVNMLVFELTTGRRAATWDHDEIPPRAGRVAAALSLALWIGVIFMGRWIGFTTTRETPKTDPAAGEINIEDLLKGPR